MSIDPILCLSVHTNEVTFYVYSAETTITIPQSLNAYTSAHLPHGIFVQTRISAILPGI